MREHSTQAHETLARVLHAYPRTRIETRSARIEASHMVAFNAVEATRAAALALLSA